MRNDGGIMPDSRLRFELLGPLRAWHGETRLDLGPVRQQAVLAALLLRPDVTVSHYELTDGLWEKPPESNVLPVYVRRLRQCLDTSGQKPRDSVIVSDRGGYRFASGGVRLDVVRLEEVAAVAAAAEESGDLVSAVDTFADALRLFHGEPLTGLPGAFVQGERRRLEERRLLLLRRKLRAQLKLGRFDEVIGELSALVSADPPSEPLAALLMRALYGGGRQAEALEVFTDVRERLIEQLGVEPGEELRQVQEAVLRGDETLLGVAPRREPSRRIRNELPAVNGELVGRDRELALLVEDGDPASVSVDAVDGVPGAGKTTLAVRAAHKLRESYPDGALFVDLHGYTEGREPVMPERALRRLLRAVGVEDGAMPDDLDELAASWRAATAQLRLLLVLDNAESAGQVRPLLPSGPGSRVLVTSRRRLSGLDADRRVSLGALGLEAAERLLGRIVGAPRAEGERFAVRALAGLCGRLPLALRIAGARLQNRPMWTFKDLVDRMSDDERRLGELTAEDRSVEVALRLSYEQLRPAEQTAFSVLGLSPTTEFDRLTVAALLDCSPAEAERQLDSLVDASLVQEPASGRYRLHDLVAVYARRLAGEMPEEAAEAARKRVYGLYLSAARRASEWGVARFPLETGGPFTGQRDASAWLDAAGDLPEVVSQAAEAGLDDLACSVAEGLVDYLARQQRYHECRTALQVALPLAEQAEDERLVSSLRFCLGYAYAMQGQLDRARGWFDDALRAGQSSGDRGVEARALGGLTMVDLIAGRHDLAIPGMRRVMVLAEEVGDRWLAERSLSALGFLAYMRGEHEEALGHLGRARELSEEIGSPGMLARVLCHSGTVRLESGSFAEAALDLRRSVELAEETTDGLLTATSLARLGAAELELGNLDAAFELQRRALTAVTDETIVGMESEIRNRLGRTHLAAGDPVAAREHFEWVLTTIGPDGDPQQRTLALEGLDLTRQSARRR
ncbi:BTAD domain-containing putative transcriptional regulator [Amycolatopsis roodepoortensis]|uniref:DNA-binding SARP family transcriptional activator/Tfp pilus assembly protein PilF n=1 Tax=Amycolatopsis roodepoortensis TaxID=700274 RepID=A0ABR9L1J1_9PSEU|nr:BTAD domain-containing putative transcriptional regulator [Amycolatopsis roodepoortensis]MBE1574048.1 DNA-binding SARP family transcriptional activator/Tfp pilus assembly protein PilF [Amycolatopsis roodepoortensis]